jgi:hypothetical protein
MDKERKAPPDGDRQGLNDCRFADDIAIIRARALELQLDRAVHLLAEAAPARRRTAWDLLVRLHGRRSARQVERLERERGLRR